VRTRGNGTSFRTLGFLNEGASGFVATIPDHGTIQIKANHASQTISIRGEADLLLMVSVKALRSLGERIQGAEGTES
jgi:hypothetical protein